MMQILDDAGQKDRCKPLQPPLLENLTPVCLIRCLLSNSVCMSSKFEESDLKPHKHHRLKPWPLFPGLRPDWGDRPPVREAGERGHTLTVSYWSARFTLCFSSLRRLLGSCGTSAAVLKRVWGNPPEVSAYSGLDLPTRKLSPDNFGRTPTTDNFRGDNFGRT